MTKADVVFDKHEVHVNCELGMDGLLIFIQLAFDTKGLGFNKDAKKIIDESLKSLRRKK